MEKKNNKKDPFKEIEMLSQPLLTEEGFVNEACINELNAFISKMPTPASRFADDPEWTVKRWIFKKEITQALAKCAVRQSPYPCPQELEEVISYLDACLEKEIEWATAGMTELSLCDINKLLYDILYEQGFSAFDNWNKSKKGDVEIQIASRYSGRPDPDYDFIDLDALLMNVCLDIRMERRADDKFNEEFEKEYEDKNE